MIHLKQDEWNVHINWVFDALAPVGSILAPIAWCRIYEYEYEYTYYY